MASVHRQGILSDSSSCKVDGSDVDAAVDKMKCRDVARFARGETLLMPFEMNNPSLGSRSRWRQHR